MVNSERIAQMTPSRRAILVTGLLACIAALGHELLVCTELDYAAGLHDGDPVGHARPRKGRLKSRWTSRTRQ